MDCGFGFLSSQQEMRKAIADADKRAQRTREVAKMKIEEFRLACYNLFGYKMQVSGAKYTYASSIPTLSPSDRDRKKLSLINLHMLS